MKKPKGINVLLKDKDFEKSHTYFDDKVKSQIPINQLGALVQQIEGKLGAFKTIAGVSGTEDILYFYSNFESPTLISSCLSAIPIRS